MINRIPKKYKELHQHYPSVGKAYEELGIACHSAGSLDEKQRALVKLGISTGGRLEGALHSHVRKALESGLTPEQIRQAIILSLPTIGLPSMMAALSWAEDILGRTSKKNK